MTNVITQSLVPLNLSCIQKKKKFEYSNKNTEEQAEEGSTCIYIYKSWSDQTESLTTLEIQRLL